MGTGTSNVSDESTDIYPKSTNADKRREQRGPTLRTKAIEQRLRRLSILGIYKVIHDTQEVP